MRRKQISLFLCAALLTASMGFAPMEALAAGEDIVILYTNDAHCAVDENIGYGGVALYKDQMEAQTPYVTLVDAGDAIQGAPIGTLSDGGYLIDIMNEVGYDFAVPGNHEFDYGMARFLDAGESLVAQAVQTTLRHREFFLLMCHLVVCSAEELLDLHLALQLHHAVEDSLRTRRTARHVHVYGHNL